MHNIYRTKTIKLLLGLIFASSFIIILPKATHADQAISDEQLGAISQHCSSITQSLKALQKSDSKTRIHLGSTYETLLKNYIIPLNLRLTRSSIQNQPLSDIQTDFVEAREQFSSQFIEYSKNLKELIALDCKNNPADFYEKLQSVRADRAKLSNLVKELRTLVDDHLSSVKTLKEEL